MVQESAFTYVLGFVGINNVLMQKNSLLAGTAHLMKVGTVVETTS